MSLPAVETPWMTAEQCAAYIQSPSLKAFYSFIEADPKFPRGRLGRFLRFNKAAVDAYMTGVRSDLHLVHTGSLKVVRRGA